MGDSTADRVGPAAAALQARIRGGDPARAEEYLTAVPPGDDDAALDLIYAEVVAREEAGQTAPLDEYTARFPAYADRLRRQFQVHAALADSFEPAETLAEGAVPDDSAPAAPDGYRILGEIGRGGMGVVYRAWQAGAERVVALKMILAGEYAGRAEAQRFAAEAALAAKVRHPNVAQLYGAGTHGRRPFLVFEYVDGPSLAGKLAGTPLAPAEAARVVAAVARAVDAAHKSQVVHRDLKPTNVLFTADGVPKVVDFGIARDLTADHTPDGAVLGTPSYMAPEQAEGNPRQVGPRTDVYAAGAVLYECLTGRPPFKAATVAATAAQVIAREPAPPRALNPAVPRDLDVICLKCLEKSPARRYASAAALADDLDRYLDGRPILARPVGAAERAVKWARRRPAAAGLLAALAVAIFASLVGLAAALRAEHRRVEEYAGQLYLYRVAKAADELAAGKPAWAREQLDLCPPGRRRWEWFALDRGARGEKPREVAGHARGVSGVAFDPAGGWLASGSGDGTVKLWNPADLAPLATLDGHGASVNAIAVSPDGRWLAAALETGAVALWDVPARTRAATLAGECGPLVGVAFSPDGTRLAAAGLGGPDRPSGVPVWDVPAGTRAALFRGHDGPVSGVAFAPDGNRLATAGHDGTVRLIDPGTGMAALIFRGHAQPVSFVAFSPDGVLAVSAAGRPEFDQPDDGVLVWEVGTGAVRHRLRGHTARVSAVGFLPGGDRVVSGSWDDAVKVWDAATGREVVSLPGSAWVLAAAADAGGRLASGGMDGTVRVWDGRSAE